MLCMMDALWARYLCLIDDQARSILVGTHIRRNGCLFNKMDFFAEYSYEGEKKVHYAVVIYNTIQWPLNVSK
jgi:hypothetical protein